MYMKVCTKCMVEKEYFEFYKRTDNKDGYRNICKKCHAIKNTPKVKIIYEVGTKQCNKCLLVKNFNEFHKRDNKDGCRNTCKLCWCIITKTRKNPDYIKNYMKDYNLKTKDYRKAYGKKYRELNPGLDWCYRKKRMSMDPFFKIKENIRRAIISSFRKNNYRKSSKTIEIIGCTYEEFRKMLENKFEIWMNWNNYGLYNGQLNHGWDIDHIIPISTATNVEELIRLNHFTNLQPLCSKINRDIKKNRLDYYK